MWLMSFHYAADELRPCAHPSVCYMRPGAFPPNTQYRLKEVRAAGEWEAPAQGVYPRRRLLVVTATYLPPHADPSGKIGQFSARLAPKLCFNRRSLLFGRKEAFISGRG